MIGKAYSISVLIITCLAVSAKADLAKPVHHLLLGFQFYDDHGVAIKYKVSNIILKYDNNDLEVSPPNPDSIVTIHIKKVEIEFLDGLIVSEDGYKEYDLPRGGKIQLAVEGTGYLSLDETSVLRCKFTFAEKNDAPIAGIAEPVKRGILRSLIKLNNSLCRTIKIKV